MNFGGLGRLAKLSGEKQDPALHTRWISAPWVQAFERGACTTEEFAQGVVNDLELDLTPAAFLDDFSQWSAGPFVGSLELVRSLHGTVAMGCLSNTNSVHWQRHLNHWGIVQYFDWTFTSHELGMMKPDPAVFRHVIRTIGTTPDRLLFLDDVNENVQAARASGMRSEQTVGVHEVEDALRSHLSADSVSGRALRTSATHRPAT